MKNINYDEINLAEIATFLSVARTLNMSVSANELFISQPAVSQRIGRLEKNFELILFVRNGSRLQLTPAGKLFYDEMNTSFGHIEAAFAKAYAAQTGTLQTLTIGHDGFFDLPLLYEMIERFKKRYPGIQVNVIHSAVENTQDLFEGKADIVIRPDSCFKFAENYVNSEYISAYQFCILVACSNPLAEKEKITIQDILNTPLITAHINADSPYLSALNILFSKYGCVPKFEQSVQHEMLCYSILNTEGVAIASPSFWTRMNQRNADFFREKIKCYPLEGEYYPVSFVWKKEPDAKCILNFLEVYHQVVSEGENEKIVWQSYNGYDILNYSMHCVQG